MKHTEYETKHARWLSAIHSLGRQLRNLDCEWIAQTAVEIMSQSLGFERVALCWIDPSDPERPHIAAQTQASPDRDGFSYALESGIWTETQDQSCCLIPAPGTEANLSMPGQPVEWQERDWVYAPLVADSLLGYAALAHPRDRLRPTQDMLHVIEIMAGQTAAALQIARLDTGIDPILDKRLAELAILREFSEQVHARLDIDYVVQTTLNWAIHTTCATGGTIVLLEDDQGPAAIHPNGAPGAWTIEHRPFSPVHRSAQERQTLRVFAHQGYPAESVKDGDSLWYAHNELTTQVMQTGEAAFINDIPQDQDDLDHMASPHSQLAIPIRREGRVVGLIYLESAVPDGFTTDHALFLSNVADLAAVAIENARLYEQTNRYSATLESLRKACADMTSSLDLDSVLDSVVTHAQALTGADHVTLYLYDPNRANLYPRTERSNRETKGHPLTLTGQRQIAQEVARQGKTQVVCNDQEQARTASAARQKSVIASIPAIKAGRVLSVLNVAFQQADALTSDKLHLLHLLAGHAALVIEHAQLYAEMQHAQDVKNGSISAVSHEFKVPMTSIQGYASLIALQASGPITEQQKTYIDIIQKNIRRINTLVDGLIDLSNAESEHEPSCARDLAG